MKNSISFLTAISIMSLAMLWSCQKPEMMESSRQGNAINSITASFPGDDSMDNSFAGEIDYENHLITIVFPYNYPLESDIVVTEDRLARIRIQANLENNVLIEPPLLFMDLTRENVITVIDNSAGTRIEYRIVAEIRKSADCELSQFNISAAGLSGVINPAARTVSLISIEDIGEQQLTEDDIIISHGATISPDPRTVALDYDDVQTFTVTAQNGVDKKEYTVRKSIPDKVPMGMRGNSGTMLWVKGLHEIAGITDPVMVSGIAVTENYVVINERGSSSLVYLNSKTGAVAGTMDISAVSPSRYGNFHATADSDGNILICNSTGTNGDNGKIFTIWKASGVDAKPEKYIEYTIQSSGMPRYGWEISVQGSIDDDAVITTPVHYDGTPKFARWQVLDGNLVSQIPDIIDLPVTDTGNWANSKWGGDIVYATTEPGGDYFLASHSKDTDGSRYLFWIDGGDNSVKARGPGAPSNTMLNSVDYADFNGGAYLIYNYVNTFTWAISASDAVNLYDISSGDGISVKIDVCESKIYGPTGMGRDPVNTSTSDVDLYVSRNGYYLYACFVFANGSIGCVQYDCIDM